MLYKFFKILLHVWQHTYCAKLRLCFELIILTKQMDIRNSSICHNSCMNIYYSTTFIHHKCLIKIVLCDPWFFDRSGRFYLHFSEEIAKKCSCWWVFCLLLIIMLMIGRNKWSLNCLNGFLFHLQKCDIYYERTHILDLQFTSTTKILFLFKSICLFLLSLSNNFDSSPIFISSLLYIF